MPTPRVTYHARVKPPCKRRFAGLLPFVLLYALKASLFVAPLAFCGLYMLQHGTPYILWEYEYYGSETHKTIISCEYYGWQGLQKITSAECPFIIFFSKA